jgi:predicted nucleotidyltransferase
VRVKWYNKLAMDDETLSQRRREYKKLLQDSVEEIIAKLSRLGVDRLSLFGSYASGKADLFTDLDILVVMDTDKPFPERATSLCSLLSLPVDVDILCYTPYEFRKLKDKPFLRRVLSQEVVLYEKKSN